MVESVGNIAVGMGAGAMRTAYASSRSVAEGDSQTSSVVREIQRLSPQMRSDPVSGVLVVQYLSEGGDVTAQIPSDAALAYLRAGLTETGHTQRDEPAASVVRTEADVLA